MKIRNIFSSLFAFALLAAQIPAVSASAVEYTAYIAGAAGGNQIWNVSEIAEPSKAAIIDGDGDYEASWYFDQPSATVEFLMLVVPDLSSNDYPNLEISVTEFCVDGSPIEYTQSEQSRDFAYSNGDEIQARVYFNGSWAGSQAMDIPGDLSVENSISVKFTVSGILGDSTSEPESESESQSEPVSESESDSRSESESVSESLSESVSQAESESTSESASESTAQSQSDDENKEESGGLHTWMILAGAGGVAVIAGIVVIIVKIRNKRYYL